MVANHLNDVVRHQQVVLPQMKEFSAGDETRIVTSRTSFAHATAPNRSTQRGFFTSGASLWNWSVINLLDEELLGQIQRRGPEHIHHLRHGESEDPRRAAPWPRTHRAPAAREPETTLPAAPREEVSCVAVALRTSRSPLPPRWSSSVPVGLGAAQASHHGCRAETTTVLTLSVSCLHHERKRRSLRRFAAPLPALSPPPFLTTFS